MQPDVTAIGRLSSISSEAMTIPSGCWPIATANRSDGAQSVRAPDSPERFGLQR